MAVSLTSVIKSDYNFAIISYLLMLGGGILTVSWLTHSIIGYLLTAILAAILATIVILGNRNITISKTLFSLLLAYYGWLLVILTLSPNPSVVIPYVVATPIILLIVFAIPPMVYPNRNLFPWFLAISGALFTVVGVVFLLVGDMIGLDLTYTGRSTYLGYQYRIQSIFRNSNNLGMFLTFSSLSGVYLIIRNWSKATIGLLGLNVVGLLLSHGRNSLGAFVVGLVFIILYRKAMVLTLGFVGAILIGHIMVISGVVDQEILAKYLSGRNYHMIASVNHFLEYPLFGNLFLSVDTSIHVARGDPGSHHTYFSMLSRAGVGAIPYIIGIVYIFFVGGKIIDSPWQRYVFGGLATSIAIMIFETITVGGLSIESLLVATYIGFVHYELVRWQDAPNM